VSEHPQTAATSGRCFRSVDYLRRYGVAVGERPVFFVNSDEAYEVAFAMIEAGIRPVAIVDPRETARAEDRARSLGVEVVSGAVVSAASGRHCIRRVTVSAPGGRKICTFSADSLLISGGYTPATALATQLGAELKWDDDIAAFTPSLAQEIGRVVGGAHGMFGLATAAFSLTVAGPRAQTNAQPNDVTFAPAADSYTHRTVGIVLTGANADGADGLLSQSIHSLSPTA